MVSREWPTQRASPGRILGRRSGRRRRYALLMQSIVLEIPRYSEPDWLEEVVHEFTEDPYCVTLLLGADEDTVMLVTIWADAVAAEVEAGLRGLTDATARVRRFELSIPDKALEIPQ